VFGKRANQGKHLALERVVERRDLNELALWMMPICSMLVRVSRAGTRAERRSG